MVQDGNLKAPVHTAENGLLSEVGDILSYLFQMKNCIDFFSRREKLSISFVEKNNNI